MQRTILTLVLLLSIVALTGCSGSAVYNPTLNLPAHPMKKDSWHLSGGFNLLPHARPHEVDRPFEFGAQGLTRYAFHDRLTLAINWWGGMTRPLFDARNWGLNGYAIYAVTNSDSGMASALIPTYGLTYLGRTIEGEGIALWYAVWPSRSEYISTYAAIAPFMGWRSGDPSERGFGGILNLGAVIAISDVMDLGLEAAGVVQVNMLDHITHVIPTPSATLTWRVQ
jgi:hypothetical protein